jgi:hypothetical protein
MKVVVSMGPKSIVRTISLALAIETNIQQREITSSPQPNKRPHMIGVNTTKRKFEPIPREFIERAKKPYN